MISESLAFIAFAGRDNQGRKHAGSHQRHAQSIRADYLPSWRWNGRTGFRGSDEGFQGDAYLARNQQSLHGSHPSQNSGSSNNLELLELAKKYETPVIFGSDAHFSAMIADYSNIMPLVEKAEFPEELVLNYQPEKFMAYLKPTPEK